MNPFREKGGARKAYEIHTDREETKKPKAFRF
jgi:hypothetical protein